MELLITIGVFPSPPALRKLINEAKAIYAIRGKRISFLIHFSLYYDFF